MCKLVCSEPEFICNGSRMTRTILILIGLMVLSAPAQAFDWKFWREKPIDTAPAVQTEAARPIYQKALAAQQKGHNRRALGLYKKIYQKYPASNYSAQALFNTGVIQYERKKWKKSFFAFQAILIQHADFPRFNEIVEYQFRIALALADGNGVRFLFVLPSRSYNRSVSYFEIVIRNAPFSDLAPLALMNVALIHQYQHDTALAVDALDRLINSYPNSLLADDAYLSLAETFADLVQGPMYDQGATREAISYFEDFLILFSTNEKVGQAEKGLAEMEDVYARSKLVIGEYYFKHRRWYQAAEIFFNEAITTAPDSPAAVTARQYIQQIETIRANFTPPTPEEQAKENGFIKRFLRRIAS